MEVLTKLNDLGLVVMIQLVKDLTVFTEEFQREVTDAKEGDTYLATASSNNMPVWWEWHSMPGFGHATPIMVLSCQTKHNKSGPLPELDAYEKGFNLGLRLSMQIHNNLRAAYNALVIDESYRAKCNDFGFEYSSEVMGSRNLKLYTAGDSLIFCLPVRGEADEMSYLYLPVKNPNIIEFVTEQGLIDALLREIPNMGNVVQDDVPVFLPDLLEKK